MLRASSLGLNLPRHAHRVLLPCRGPRFLLALNRSVSDVPRRLPSTQNNRLPYSERKPPRDNPVGNHCTRKKPAYAAGRPWRQLSIKPLQVEPHFLPDGLETQTLQEDTDVHTLPYGGGDSLSQLKKSTREPRKPDGTPQKGQKPRSMTLRTPLHPDRSSQMGGVVKHGTRVLWGNALTAGAEPLRPNPLVPDYNITSVDLLSGEETVLNPRNREDSVLGNAEIGPVNTHALENHLIDIEDPVLLRRHFLHILANTSSATEIWDAYSALLAIPHLEGRQPKIPFSHLHRVSRVLARNRPKTRAQFVRLLSVLQFIRKSGGIVHLHEWNALIHNAGRGWRKTRPEDFQLALDIYRDMVLQKAPGSTSSGSVLDEGPSKGDPVEPNIVTYTTLLGIAVRTLHPPIVRHATSLLQESGLQPNRITHLSMLRYFTFTKQLSGVRSTLTKMKQQGLELGLDGINACLWAYAHSDRPDLVMKIYRILRHNITAELYSGDGDVDSIAQELKDEEDIDIDNQIKPNEITFTLVVQAMAHHGDLMATLNVFMDMLSSFNIEMGAPLVSDASGKLKPSNYSPTLPVFRAIFLGFARHGVPSNKKGSQPALRPRSSRDPNWTLDSLLSLFDVFMTLPEHINLSQGVIYWIMVAFGKTSGHDPELLRDIWRQLEERFNGPWGSPDNRLQRLRANLFSEDKAPGKPNRWA